MDISPLQPQKKTPTVTAPVKSFYPYEPNATVCRFATHVFGHRLFIIRRLESTPDKEAYQARYLNNQNELVIDVFYPQEFKFSV